mmetsp:Transcript_8671/g.7968  ORF Transcript_8671/g.7968 Transcript_8671/m.7968 type:complete len:140 (+) Transcript_8671:693-1112(+)|eukprot:CAMPEP_0170545222 /NCGR_PEP_ID=MMETSP0211-20121228/3688_1 /TAXON_ID=311385 /ORGANISM="Pseudokeronopsis sp., Strain OXSARD2" /LENGTH=139 /DNA_ID=CAMNT_0010849067 /DNA_START=1063 /DNA_END=1482 /DNA_ORIENTATION=+
MEYGFDFKGVKQLMIGANPNESEEDWIFGLTFILQTHPYISYDEKGVGFRKATYDNIYDSYNSNNFNGFSEEDALHLFAYFTLAGVALLFLLAILQSVFFAKQGSCKEWWRLHCLCNCCCKEDQREDSDDEEEEQVNLR